MSQVIYYAHGSPGRESGVVSDCDTMAELSTLLHSEIPEGRSNLTDNHTNLERVAEYCEANYFQSDSKRGALEETKNYTTQSLASVAYQINTLAYNFLQLLELQTSQLAEMESQMNHISQTVMIHKEKVARREIGVLTANKSTTRHYKIIAPAVPEKPIKYIRRAIDYNVLDDIGHGVIRSGTTRGPNKGSLQRGNSQSGSMQALVGNNGVMIGQAIPGGGVGQISQPGVGPAPTTKPPTPPSVTRTGSKVSVSGGTLSKGSNREYRTPPAVAPPQVPIHYAPNYPLGHPRRAPGGSDSNSSGSGGGGSAIISGGAVGPRGPGYSALPLGQQQIMSPPGAGQQVGMVHPMHQPQQQQQQHHPQTPPPPPPPNATGNSAVMYSDHHNSMPPPPSPLTIPITTNSQQHQTLHQINPQQPPTHFSHSLLLPQHGPVPAGSLGMHTLSHHHQAQYLQSIQRSLGSGAINNRTSSNDGVNRGSTSGGGQNSPPLPPPPPMADTNDADDVASVVHAAFGRPQGRGRGSEVDMVGGGGGGVKPIVPDEEDLPGWVPKNYIEKVVAIYDYYADKDDELSFQESSVIYVLKKNDDGWWEGVMDGITGLFPGNYVEPCV